MVESVNNTKIIITVDTEVGEKAKCIQEGFDRFIQGKIGNEYYGIQKIVDILDIFNFTAEFFVDVYEYEYFGEDRYQELCKYLRKKGHGIQLHTHPSYAYDINRINMYEYSLEEQLKIISQGKELINKWIGGYPIAHRAGNYGANNDTFTALQDNNIYIDSSFFYKHKNCKIQLSTVNEPIFHNKILEVPITVIKKYPKLLGFPVIVRGYWVKLDINMLDYHDLKKAFLSLSNKCKYIICFLHSSSFVLREESGTAIKGIDNAALTTFNEILGYIYENDDKYEIINLERCYREIGEDR